jgi:hypothetical protein
VPFSGILRRVTLVRTEVSEERSAFINRVTRIGELGTTFAVTSNRRIVFLCSMRRLLVTANVVPSSPFHITLNKEALRSSETSVLTGTKLRSIPEDCVLQSIPSHTITLTSILALSCHLHPLAAPTRFVSEIPYVFLISAVCHAVLCTFYCL